MSKQPFISIPLDIPDVRVLQTDLTQANEFILTVESTLTSTTCRRCGRLLRNVDFINPKNRDTMTLLCDHIMRPVEA